MEIIILGFLILLNGFFALSEIALVSSKRSRLEQAKQEGSRGAKIALHLLNSSENFLSAIQVGITLIGIVTGVYGGMNIADDVTPIFQGIDFTREFASEIALLLTVLVITYISIVIGELVPKTIALSNPEKTAIRVAPVISFLSTIFFPFVKFLSISTNFINKAIGIKKRDDHITEQEIRQLIKIASTEGVIEKDQNIIHENIFYFSDKKAKHIMTHRTDVEWVNIDRPDEEIRTELNGVVHSKVVCCSETLDNFQGVLFLKDFYKSMLHTSGINIRDLLVPPIVVFENASAQKVLELFRFKKIHFCCVVNEYGGLEGIITLHDIIENIVGQIPDEGEVYEPDIFIRDDKSVLVSGEASIEILAEIIENFRVDFDQIDYATVAGFVLSQINRIPRIGDKFEYKGYRIEIIDVDINKIDKILVSKV